MAESTTKRGSGGKFVKKDAARAADSTVDELETTITYQTGLDGEDGEQHVETVVVRDPDAVRPLSLPELMETASITLQSACLDSDDLVGAQRCIDARRRAADGHLALAWSMLIEQLEGLIGTPLTRL